MVVFKIILWLITGISIWIFMMFFVPYIKTKWRFFVLSRRVKRMAKKHTGETRDSLNVIADQLMDISRNEKLVDDDE